MCPQPGPAPGFLFGSFLLGNTTGNRHLRVSKDTLRCPAHREWNDPAARRVFCF